MEISEIKQGLTLSTVLQYYGLKPDKNFKLNCPFHDDKTPSMQVYYKTQTAYCFSSKCKTHGKSLDVIDFVMHKENADKHNALLKCIELLGAKPPVKRSLEYQDLPMEKLEEVFSKMKSNLKQSKTAITYCGQRSLDTNKLEIGYNGRTYKGLFHCIVFPLRDKSNKITSFYGRSTVNETDSKHFYLKESTGLYPNYPNPNTEKLIIAESIIDTVSLLQIESITKNYSILASYGTNRLNDEIKTAIQELTNLNEIIFAFDNDEAGNKAIEKYSNELRINNEKLIISKLDLPCKDVNETLQAHEKEVFIHLLENRKSIISIQEETIDFSFSTENSIEKKEILSSSNPINPNSDTLNTDNPYKLIYQTKTATYTIKGGIDKQLTKLQITLEIDASTSSATEAINKRRFKTDLYDNKQVEKLLQEASELLQLNYNSLEKDLHKLTDLLDEYRESESQPNTETETQPSIYTLTTQERVEAESFAKDPNLIQSITEKLTQTGIVGEDENKTFLFIIATSHIQENPLNALIQGSSGSGKTNLLKGIYKIMPEESKKIYSRCSEKMLYNVPKYYFKNKLICFEDVDGLGEEAEYAWRELVSNGELISGVSYKDDKGNIGVKELVVYGPITSLACTTKGAIYADNMSRLFLIAIDESKTQTQRINEYQAKEAAGLINKQAQKQTLKLLQNYVRILQPFQVHNPHATKLKLPEGIRDERRLYRLYLYFIDMITVLHQHQRQQKNNKLVATKQDCQLAKDLLFECIMLKMDELDGSLRQFFERLKTYIKSKNNEKYPFTQRELREALKVSKTQLFRYITELKEMEYVQEVRGGGNQGNSYQIKYWDNYQKVRNEVKEFLQNQIDSLNDE